MATRFGGLCLEAKSEARRFEAFSLTDVLSPEANCPLANLSLGDGRVVVAGVVVVGWDVVSLREPRFRRSEGRNGRILERIGELEVVGAGEELEPLDEELLIPPLGRVLVLDLSGVNLEDPLPLVNPPLLLPLDDEVGLTVVVFLAFF